MISYDEKRDPFEFLIKLIEDSNSDRFSFEWSGYSGKDFTGSMEMYDRIDDIGYVIKIEPIKYDENNEPINL